MNQTVLKLLETLTKSGIEIKYTEDGRLLLRPDPPENLLKKVRDNKPAILSLLRVRNLQPSLSEPTELESLQEPGEFSEGKTLTDSSGARPGSPNAEILNRLGEVAISAVQYAGKLKDFLPDQDMIRKLLDQAHEIEITEPLNSDALVKIIVDLEILMFF